MKTLNTILITVTLAAMVLTSCEDEFVVPTQVETENTEEGIQTAEEDSISLLLVGNWFEKDSSKDSIALSFDGLNCHFYSINNGVVFDFTLAYNIEGNLLTFEDNVYLLHDMSTIEIIDSNNFKMTTSHLVDTQWLFTDEQYFTRIN